MPSSTLHPRPDRPAPMRSLTISSDFTERVCVWGGDGIGLSILGVGRVGDFFLKTFSSTLRDRCVTEERENDVECKAQETECRHRPSIQRKRHHICAKNVAQVNFLLTDYVSRYLLAPCPSSMTCTGCRTTFTRLELLCNCLFSLASNMTPADTTS